MPLSDEERDYWESTLKTPGPDDPVTTPSRRPTKRSPKPDWIPVVKIHDSLKGLPPRQAEVLMRIASGISSGVTQRDIALAMGIHEALVSDEKTDAMRKLGLSGTPSLIRFFIQQGIIEP